MKKLPVLLLFAAIGQAQTLASLQAAYLAMKCGSSYHWNMSTFQANAQSGGGWGWATPAQSPSTFNPAVSVATITANIDGWMQATRAAGCGYVFLSTKHIDGFKLWPSTSHIGAPSVYGIQNTTWYQNNGSPDLVNIFVTEARKYGLKPGLYYAIMDRTMEFYNANCGNTPTGTIVPVQTTHAATCYPDYMTMIQTELTELLSNYGSIVAVLTDGWGYWAGYTNINYTTVYNLIKTLQPGCLLIENGHQGNLTHTDIVLYELPYSGEVPFPANNTTPSDTWQTVRTGQFAGGSSLVPEQYWFYNPGEPNYYGASMQFSPRYYYNFASYYLARNSNAMVNLEPGTDGALPAAETTFYPPWQFESRFKNNLAAGITPTISSQFPGSGAAGVLTDNVFLNVFGNITTIVNTASNDTAPYAEINLGTSSTIGRVEIFNRSDVGDVHPGRLRDLTVTLYDASHVQVYQVTGINAGNLGYGSYVGDGTYTTGPGQLTVLTLGYKAQYVRIARTPDPSAPTQDDKNCLVMAEAQVFPPGGMFPMPGPKPIR